MSDPRPLPPAGLCADCRHAAIVASPRSRFLRCRRADTDPAYARYPALPVLVCRGYEGGGGSENTARARRSAR